MAEDAKPILTVDHYYKIYSRRKEGYGDGDLKYSKELYDQVCNLLEKLEKYSKEKECKLSMKDHVAEFVIDGKVVAMITHVNNDKDQCRPLIAQ